MFDIGAAELLVIVIVAVIVIGPKDLPLAMRVAGRWIGKIRRVSAHFRSGIDAMVREAELEDMEKKWKAQNEEIMRRSAALTEAEAGTPLMTGPPPIDAAAGDAPATGVDAGSDAASAPAPTAPPPSPAAPSGPRKNRAAIITVGSPAPLIDTAPEPILPALPHTSGDDVQG